MTLATGLIRMRTLPEWCLIAITCIWGATFLVVHHAMASSGPLAFVASRFGIAAIITALLCNRALLALTRAELRSGVMIGMTIFGGYALQTWGLAYIPGSKSAFITAFYVPLVPIFQWLFLRHRTHLVVWLAIALSFSGLILLTATGQMVFEPGSGELLTVAGAMSIALEIILISRVPVQQNILRVTVIQLLTASIIALAAMLLTGEPAPVNDKTFWLSTLSLGCASALIQYVMNWAQKRVSATRATLIYASEPVWAGVIGRVAGDRLSGIAIVGAVMIVCASVLSEWRPKK